MADQRADTPRTAAGRKLLARRSLFYKGKSASITMRPEQWTEAILAIEAEAAADSANASEKPAAAEPPDLTIGEDASNLPDDDFAEAETGEDLGAARSRSIDAIYRAEERLVDAQPPRGSLPDRSVIARAVGKALYGWGDDEPNTATGFLVRHDVKAVTDAVLAVLAGGSLTATAQATPSEEPPDGS